MKERQRWQPEEDALLISYVKQYGPKEWNLISQRMGKTLNRDSKSCLERWKNYLKPGIKKGSLTLEEQNLVISLQSKYGNKWKKIASLVPGRTAKRLGKWWEVFKEKQIKLKTSSSSSTQNFIPPLPLSSCSTSTSLVATDSNAVSSSTNDVVEKNLHHHHHHHHLKGKYDHIIETFAEKFVQPKFNLNQLQQPTFSHQSPKFLSPFVMPNLSLGSSSISTTTDVNLSYSFSPSTVLPPWMSSQNMGTSTLSSSSSSTTPSPSVSLTLSPSEPLQGAAAVTTRFDSVGNQVLSLHQMGTLAQYCKELEEGRQNWVQHKKEANWMLSRLEQQLESEKSRKRREIMEEFEKKIKCLREEEMYYFEGIESEYVEEYNAVKRDAEIQEAKMVEIWCSKHLRFSEIVEYIKDGYPSSTF